MEEKHILKILQQNSLTFLFESTICFITMEFQWIKGLVLVTEVVVVGGGAFVVVCYYCL